MSRQFALASSVAAALVASLLAPPATGAVTEWPRLDCKTRIIDPPGDASLAAGTALATHPQTAPTFAVDSTDLTSMFLRLTADELQILMKFKDLKAPDQMPEAHASYRYVLTGKLGAKTLEVKLLQLNPKEPWKTYPTPPDGAPIARTGSGPENMLPGWQHEFRHADDFLIVTMPRARLEENLGDTLGAGDMVQLGFNSWVHVADYRHPMDTLNSTPPVTFDLGDESCFGPPPSTLSDLAVPATVQFGDTAAVKATLRSEAGSPLAGRAVEFKLGDSTAVSATTGTDGVATTKIPASFVAGAYAVVATFAGDSTDGKSRVSGGVLKVVAEGTAFGTPVVAKPTRSTRVVTAVLLEDDKAPVVGQPVAWYVNGKKVATLTTDGKGKTVFKAAKPTQTVQAKFLGVAGKYTAASSRSVKV